MAFNSADLLQWLQNTSAAIIIRQSTWLYPGLEVMHLVGIVLLVGPAFLFDLRLLGLAPTLPLKPLADYLLPWSRKGLLLVVPSGFLLFIANASDLGFNPTFWLKMLLLILAGLNALVFHKVTFPSALVWSKNKTFPIGAKAAGVVSIILWLAVIICGRWLAY